MPDPMMMGKAVVLSGLVALIVMLVSGAPWAAPRARGRSVGWTVGVGAAFYVGCWMLDVRPEWPAREDQDRFLILLMPSVLAVEVVAAMGALPSRFVWLLRVFVAACAAGVLLHNSGYVADLAGPGSRKWSTGVSLTILGGLGLAFVGVWLGLTSLASSLPSRALPVALALANGGAAVTVMLSGYATGGQPGIALAAGLFGATVGSCFIASGEKSESVVGVGLAGLFAVLVSGHYFGELRALHGVVLFMAPLLSAIAAWPRIRAWRPAARCTLQVTLVGIPIVIVLYQAMQAFQQDYTPAGAESGGVSIEDYAGYGS